MKKVKPTDWSLAQVWNRVATKPDRPLVKRDYVYASELGGAMCDRILKMRATPPTNPPNDRSRRKFLSGNLFEYIVKVILIASGVFEVDEQPVNATPYDGLLAVHGRLDFRTHKGLVDMTVAMARLNLLALPDYIHTIGSQIIGSLEGVSLKEKILELKSVSSYAFERVESLNAPIYQHTIQAYHYQKNTGLPADIIYCSRDDLRMIQFMIIDKFAEPLYKKDLEQITDHFKHTKKLPPIEPLAKFDELTGKFSKNLSVEWSSYLTMLYGFKTPEDYRQRVNFILSWNRTLTRYVLAETGKLTPTGKPIVITPKNKEVRAEIEKAKYNFNDLIQTKIQIGINEEELETVV